jgi:hypothetical protein
LDPWLGRSFRDDFRSGDGVGERARASNARVLAARAILWDYLHAADLG